jgi:hypothetical protein
MEQKNLEIIEKQIRDNYHKAFYDLIDETINSSKPDYDWIVKLYDEIKIRMLVYIKKDSKTYVSIEESFDTKLFEQMIKNDVFDAVSMIKLVDNTFHWIKLLQAPYRDEASEIAKKTVLSAEPTKIVSTFLREIYKLLDFLDEDMEKLFKEKI